MPNKVPVPAAWGQARVFVESGRPGGGRPDGPMTWLGRISEDKQAHTGSQFHPHRRAIFSLVHPKDISDGLFRSHG
jgi:hypothetical protein